MIDIVAFDADDTLWHTETLFTMTTERFRDLLAPYVDSAISQEELYQMEVANLHYFGYGIKNFTISMIETAVKLTEGRITGHEIGTIIDFAKDMMKFPVQLLDHVGEVVPLLAKRYTLMLISKGDLFDQESKIAQSGLAEYFHQIEIVSDKTQESYQRLFRRHGIQLERFLMVGNSLRSDILPILALGGRAVYIPYPQTWAHEQISEYDHTQPGFFELQHIGLLPALIKQLEDEPSPAKPPG